MKYLVPTILTLLTAGCALKNTWLLENCGKVTNAAFGPRVPRALTAESCREEAACDVRVFDPSGEDSNGVPFPTTVTIDGSPVSLNVFRYNTFSAMKEATDPSEYDRTEVACYFAFAPLKVDKSGRDYSQTLSEAVTEIRARCLQGVSQ